MKFISDNGKSYETLEACQKADAEYAAALKLAEEEKKKKSKERESRAKEVEAAYKAMVEAQNKYVELKNAFIKDYQRLYINIDTTTPKGFNDLFNFMFNL